MATWEVNQVLEGISTDYYLGFTTGAYTWAEPKAGVIAFLAGDFLTDLVLMKSEDNGNTWQKTIVWEHPYPFMEMFTFNADPYYCNDGSITLALDSFGDAHLAFGITKIIPTTQVDSLWYDPEIEGIAYWHEGMETFSNDINALNTQYHPDSELVEDYNLIAWLQDVDGNGEINLEPDIISYPTPGMVNMPQLSIDCFNQIGFYFSAITETYSNGIFNYRHIWHRQSVDNGVSWGSFYDFTDDLIHIFDECVYPVATPLTEDFWLLSYSTDDTPGIAYMGHHEYQENRMIFGEYYKGIYPTPWIITDFSSYPDTVFENDTVYFINESIGYPFPNTYLWEFEGGIPATSEVFEPFVVYPTAGEYDVSLTSSSISLQSTELKESYITVLQEVDIPETEDLVSFIISPNPSKGKFNIGLLTLKEYDIKILNTAGEVIFKENFYEGKQNLQINLSDQVSGVYYLIYNSKKTNSVEKIILLH